MARPRTESPAGPPEGGARPPDAEPLPAEPVPLPPDTEELPAEIAALPPAAEAFHGALAEVLLRRFRERGRFALGIRAPIGAGKGTLVRSLARRLARAGVRVATLSLDDLYLPGPEAARRRGPPGTHDRAEGRRVLRDFRSGVAPLLLPRYDKGAGGGVGDRGAPAESPSPDVLLFEGWFVGNLPRPEEEVRAHAGVHLPALGQTDPDAGVGRAARGVRESRTAPDAADAEDRIRRAIEGNRALEDYRLLWRELDALWVLQAGNPAWIRRWRHEQEAPRQAAGVGLSAEDVDRLVDRLLTALPPSLHAPPGGEEIPVTLSLVLGEDRLPIGGGAGPFS